MDTPNNTKAVLSGGAKELALDLSEHQLDQLVLLQQELLKWNHTFNLTAITDPLESLKLHFLDSLAIAPFWRFENTLDVGTGAGFPGLPLAIALPQYQFHLLDSNGKKTRFIRQQAHQLGLSNVTVHHSRVELLKQPLFDCVVSRAFASVNDMLELSAHLLKPKGRWMAMKGAMASEEVEQLPPSIQLLQTHQLFIPGLDAERYLLELARRND